MTVLTSCPECGSSNVRVYVRDVSVRQGFGTLTTHQAALACECGEVSSTADQCAEADNRLIAMGWKPRGLK